MFKNKHKQIIESEFSRICMASLLSRLSLNYSISSWTDDIFGSMRMMSFLSGRYAATETARNVKYYYENVEWIRCRNSWHNPTQLCAVSKNRFDDSHAKEAFFVLTRLELLVFHRLIASNTICSVLQNNRVIYVVLPTDGCPIFSGVTDK